MSLSGSVISFVIAGDTCPWQGKCEHVWRAWKRMARSTGWADMRLDIDPTRAAGHLSVNQPPPEPNADFSRSDERTLFCV